jgi:hypothetical protein
MFLTYKEKPEVNRWYFLPIFFAFGLVFWQLGPFAFFCWVIFSGLIFYRWQFFDFIRASVFFLVVTVLFMILVQDEMAKISATFIYYFILMGVLYQVIKSRIAVINLRMIFSTCSGIKKNRKAADLQIKEGNQELTGSTGAKALIKTINIFIVVLYLLLFGFTLPNENNYFGFLIFAFIFFLVNFLFFFGNELKRFFGKKYFIGKNKLVALFINISVLIVYFSIFDFWPSENGSYYKYIAFAFILVIINIIIIIDISNEK